MSESDPGQHELLGSPVITTRPLGGEATYFALADHRELVHKGVPRQSRPMWQSGQPWTELVVLDLLHYHGASVPKLVAADLQAGWMLYEYEQGDTLASIICQEASPPIFPSLARELATIQNACMSASEDLAPYAAAADPDDFRALASGLTWLLAPAARPSWRALINLCLDPDALCLGPVDVQPANALWNDDRVLFIDFGTVGPDYTERRLVSYCQLVSPQVGTLLTPEAYQWYKETAGYLPALRLAFFDLLFWGLALSRLEVVRRQPHSPVAQAIAAAWTHSDALWSSICTLWQRTRLDDPHVMAVTRGLRVAFS